MKVICRDHGAHFEADEGFLGCLDWWTSHGMATMPATAKIELATWLFQMPADKIWGDTGWGIEVQVGGAYVGFDKALTNIPGYEDMTEEERQNWQKWNIKQMLEKQQQKGLKRWISKLRKK